MRQDAATDRSESLRDPGRSPNSPADEEESGECVNDCGGEHVTEVFTGFGEKGVSAESVPKRAVDAARNYLASEAPVGRHLADQILLPMALVGGGEFVTMPLTQHFESPVAIIGAFLDRKIGVNAQGNLMLVRIESPNLMLARTRTVRQ